jgi:hypothetical protein
MKTEVFDTGALTNREMLLAAYASFNARDIDAALALQEGLFNDDLVA